MADERMTIVPEETHLNRLSGMQTFCFENINLKLPKKRVEHNIINTLIIIYNAHYIYIQMLTPKF
jgi:hypothetical protein